MKIHQVLIVSAVIAQAAQAGEMGAGTENRQWLAPDQTPVSLLSAAATPRAVVELKEAAANLNYDSVTKVWGIPVPRLGDPDYAPTNLNYTGVVRTDPLTLPARVYVPDGKLDRTLPCILVTDGYGVGGAPPAGAPGGGPGGAPAGAPGGPPGGAPGAAPGGEEGGGPLHALVAQGYTGVNVALRQASSEPQSSQVGLNGYYTHYGEDGVAIINEMVRRYGCGMTGNNPDTARIGMVGASLVGGSQWAVVGRSEFPPALKAIAPDSPGINHLTYSTLWYPGGMLPGPQRITRPGQELASNYPGHRDFDAFWQDIQISSGQLRAAASRKLAVLFTGGWYEYNSPGNLAAYEAFNALAGVTNKRLVVSPTGHTMPEWLYRPLVIQWMAKYLKGEVDQIAQPPVLIYVRNADRWRAEQAWPIADTHHVTLQLSAANSGTISSRNDGSLQVGSAVAGAPARYDYDPVNGPFLHVMVGGQGGGPPRAPAAAASGKPVYNGSPVKGNMADDDRKVVTWTSGTLDQPMEITGNPVLKFWAASSTDDADFVASLTDVAPDGTSSLIIQGYLNGPREAYTHSDPVIAPPVPMVPGVARPFTLRLLPTAYVVPAGHRVRIAIGGGADLAVGQGQAQGPGKNAETFEVSILQSAGKAATLDLPVIGTPAAAFRAKAAKRATPASH
ncbi:MAG TPA: CocE/NonD family hydrolase [Steroidobacteraceae bacterium]|nr:CocE/NonD family hydrolase [Steroidobacteraceae bacterium]